MATRERKNGTLSATAAMRTAKSSSAHCSEPWGGQSVWSGNGPTAGRGDAQQRQEKAKHLGDVVPGKPGQHARLHELGHLLSTPPETSRTERSCWAGSASACRTASSAAGRAYNARPTTMTAALMSSGKLNPCHSANEGLSTGPSTARTAEATTRAVHDAGRDAEHHAPRRPERPATPTARPDGSRKSAPAPASGRCRSFR